MAFFFTNQSPFIVACISLFVHFTGNCVHAKTKLHLPPLMGVAWAEFQNSGNTLANSQWNAWQHTYRPYKPTIHGGQLSGSACDHWNRYAEDIQLVKDLGCNACRFSLDWSMIEPEQGVFNQEALNHYHHEINEMLRQGLIPMATMHHFVHPQWFEQLGGFEKLENIVYFEQFCLKIFLEFHHKITLWCTINEPAPFAFQGYINQAFPPGLCDLQKAGTVLRNMLLAHVSVYQKIKALPEGKRSQIGLVHQYLTFEGYTSWNIIENLSSCFLNYFFNTVILSFLKTGQFSFRIPFAALVELDYSIKKKLPHLKLDQRPYFDFIGLNYYSRVVIKQQSYNVLDQEFVIPSCKEGEVMTDMPYPLFALGLYDAIKHVAEFGVPIYITENGVADAQDDRREQFFKEYLGVLSQAIHDGYDIRGWFYWSLMDNFEWNDGFDPKFGLYSVNFTTQERKIRPSAKWLQELLHKNKVALIN